MGILNLLFIPVYLILVVLVNKSLVNHLIELELAIKDGKDWLATQDGEYYIEIYLFDRFPALDQILYASELDQIKFTECSIAAEEGARIFILLLWCF